MASVFRQNMSNLCNKNRHSWPLITVIMFMMVTACSDGATGTGKSAASDPGGELGSDLGRREFRACATCHSVRPPDQVTQRRIGPSLYDIIGKKAATQPDYAYSPAMRRADLVWSVETLDAYLARPSAIVPGTRMSFAGEPDAATRAAIIDYLIRTSSGTDESDPNTQ